MEEVAAISKTTVMMIFTAKSRLLSIQRADRGGCLVLDVTVHPLRLFVYPFIQSAIRNLNFCFDGSQLAVRLEDFPKFLTKAPIFVCNFEATINN